MNWKTKTGLREDQKRPKMQYLSKEERYSYYFPRLPRLYWIDINSTCNLYCVMCPQSRGSFKRKPEMPMSMFKEIIDSICQNKPLIKLYMSGEPLLHQDLFAMIEYAAISGCQTMVHTNATLLTEEKVDRLLSSQLSYLSFSFDGCSPEIYERLRPPARYDQVKSNIIYYLNLKKQKDDKGPHTSIEIIKMADTEKMVHDFTAYWEKSGVDEVYIREYQTWLNTVADRRSETPFRNGYKPCVNVFNVGCILSDGTVVPCCLDVYGKMPLGNVAEKSFRAIWYGEKYLQLRKQMIEGNLEQGSICLGCENTARLV